MTKKQFNRLLKQTKEHWKNDILKAPVKLLRQETPILAKKCAVCKFFTDNYRKNGCWECFLRGGGTTLYERSERCKPLYSCISRFRLFNSLCSQILSYSI